MRRVDPMGEVFRETLEDEHGRPYVKVVADRTDLPVEIQFAQPQMTAVRENVILTLDDSKRLRRALKRAERAHRAAVR